MPNWSLPLIWFALIAWRLGSAAFLVMQGQESELTLRINWVFWLGYAFLWNAIQYPNTRETTQKEDGLWGGLYCFAWVFLVCIT
jgi:hypothetical protein